MAVAIAGAAKYSEIVLIDFQKTVRALSEAILPDATPANIERVAAFVIAQHGRMPDYLREAMRLATLVFDGWPVPTTGRPFHRLPVAERGRRFRAWKQSRLATRRDLARFYESLITFGAASEHDATQTR